MTFKVRLGTPDDMDAIIRLIGQAAEWLRTKNTDQWSVPWPDERERDDRVLRGLRAGRTWIVEDADDPLGHDCLPVATITCRSDAHPKLWKEQEQDEPAVYVSRLIVNRNCASRGIGEELLNWAGKWAANQYGARWIRIDVWTTNIALQGYYQQGDFNFVRFCDDVDYPSAALFQKSTAGLERAETPRLRDIPQLLGPMQSFEIPERTFTEPLTLHGRKNWAASTGRLSARLNASPLCLLTQRRQNVGRKKLIIACCAYATWRSLSRCRLRLLELKSVAPGLHHTSRRKALQPGHAAAAGSDIWDDRAADR